MTTQSEMGVVVKEPTVVGSMQANAAVKNDGTCPTLTSAMGMGGGQTPMLLGLQVRKLTPKECWRLQGWGIMRADGTFDDSAFEKAKAAGVSDSQLYKQAGNGCSANVVEAIGRRLKEVEGDNNGQGDQENSKEY